jgi:hypothetical protein
MVPLIVMPILFTNSMKHIPYFFFPSTFFLLTSNRNVPSIPRPSIHPPSATVVHKHTNWLPLLLLPPLSFARPSTSIFFLASVAWAVQSSCFFSAFPYALQGNFRRLLLSQLARFWLFPARFSLATSAAAAEFGTGKGNSSFFFGLTPFTLPCRILPPPTPPGSFASGTQLPQRREGHRLTGHLLLHFPILPHF